MKNKKIEQIRDMVKRNDQTFTPDERALMKKYRFDPIKQEVFIITSKHKPDGQRIDPPDRDFEILKGLEKKLGLHVINVRVLANEKQPNM